MDPIMNNNTVKIHVKGVSTNPSFIIRTIATQTPKHTDKINLLPALKVIRFEQFLQFHSSQISLNIRVLR